MFVPPKKLQTMDDLFWLSGHHPHVQDAAAQVPVRENEKSRGTRDADLHDNHTAKICLKFKHLAGQCDQMTKLFFNICSFTAMKMSPMAFKIYESSFKILPKWQTFPKSGHSGRELNLHDNDSAKIRLDFKLLAAKFLSSAKNIFVNH